MNKKNTLFDIFAVKVHIVYKIHVYLIHNKRKQSLKHEHAERRFISA